MQRRILLYTTVFVCLVFIFSSNAFAQAPVYIDGRPAASMRMPVKDEGIIVRYGNGPDSCDAYGAREAVVNRVGDTYYLFYDGAGKDGWVSCLAESRDLKTWIKKGAILTLGAPGTKDAKSASSPWVIKEKGIWHMFYLGTPNTTKLPNRIPSFPYLTMKARSKSLEGPWVKQYDVTPFPPKAGSFYEVTASPGFIVKYKNEYLQFFSGAIQNKEGTKRTLGIARTRNLDISWKIDNDPIFPLSEQVENSSLFFEKKIKTWFLFTNHIGINQNREEYTDAIWVYWSKDINKWDTKNKAVVLDSSNCTWAKGAIGMPSVIKAGKKLALFYDAPGGNSISHMKRNIGLAWIHLPLQIPGQEQ
ncbi:MAG: hypothetical protein Q8891_04305 [Bacteroidota bacterium]|nr:hypothetical protein [Bacteroidota bacterium]